MGDVIHIATNLQVPTEQDWGEFDADLDQQYAHQNSSGKCIDEYMTARFSNKLLLGLLSK